jgi:hypothetical protein
MHSRHKMQDPAVTANTKAISFGEIIQGRDSMVRVTNDGLIYATDLVQVMTGKSGKRAARVLHNLKDDLFPRENIIERPSSWSGRPLRLVNFDKALELVMVIPGPTAIKTRVEFKGIITRYIQGDQTLHAEINTNASSTSRMAELARGSQYIPRQRTTGIKRRYREIADPPDNSCTPAHLDYINKALALQQQALELRHEQEREPTIYLGVEAETVYSRALQASMSKENEILEEEDKEVAAEIVQLQTRLAELDKERKETQLKIGEQIDAIRILSGLHTQPGTQEG